MWCTAGKSHTRGAWAQVLRVNTRSAPHIHCAMGSCAIALSSVLRKTNATSFSLPFFLIQRNGTLDGAPDWLGSWAAAHWPLSPFFCFIFVYSFLFSISSSYLNFQSLLVGFSIRSLSKSILGYFIEYYFVLWAFVIAIHWHLNISRVS
jgi:hypothetical protein